MNRSHWAQWFCMNKNTLKAILLLLYGIENFYDAIKLMGIFINNELYSRGFDVLIAPNYLIFSSCSSVYSVIHIIVIRSIIREYLTKYSGDIWYQEEFFVCILIRTIQFHISPFIMFNFIDIRVMCSYWVYQIDFNFVWMTVIDISSDKKTDLISFLFYSLHFYLHLVFKSFSL